MFIKAYQKQYQNKKFIGILCFKKLILNEFAVQFFSFDFVEIFAFLYVCVILYFKIGGSIQMKRKLIAITILAARDSIFFLGVAKSLNLSGYNVCFINFYEPDTFLLRQSGFEVFCVQEQIRDPVYSIQPLSDLNNIQKNYGIESIRDLIFHEKLTFSKYSEGDLIKKALLYLAVLDNILIKSNPDIVIQELGGFIAPLSLFHSCLRNNIRHYFIEPMPFKGTIGLLENCINYSVDDIELQRSWSDFIKNYQQQYQDRKFIIIPDKDKHHFMDAKFGKFINQRNLKILWKKIVNKYVLRYFEEYNFILNHVLRNFQMAYNRFFINNLYSDFEKFKSNKYVFFPLHVRLDFQLTVRSPEWLDQITLIEQISNLLPFGVDLVIKEHPASVGSYSKIELKSLLKNKNIKIVRPSVNAFDLIKFSEAVVTINSKVGTEAIMQQKPLFILGEVPYKNLNFCISVNSIRELKIRLNDFLEHRNSYNFDWSAASIFFEKLYNNSHTAELYLNDLENYDLFAKAIERAYSEGKSFKAKSDWVD